MVKTVILSDLTTRNVKIHVTAAEIQSQNVIKLYLTAVKLKNVFLQVCPTISVKRNLTVLRFDNCSCQNMSVKTVHYEFVIKH